MIKEPRYRLNVGLIVVNHKGKLLLCKRKDSDNWQFPQGGIDLGEKAEETALRELYEEVGIRSSNMTCLKKVYKNTFLKINLKVKNKNGLCLNS
jgi:putative (di)nucleoside polyphosphate hydrolase